MSDTQPNPTDDTDEEDQVYGLNGPILDAVCTETDIHVFDADSGDFSFSLKLRGDRIILSGPGSRIEVEVVDMEGNGPPKAIGPVLSEEIHEDIQEAAET